MERSLELLQKVLPNIKESYGGNPVRNLVLDDNNDNYNYINCIYLIGDIFTDNKWYNSIRWAIMRNDLSYAHNGLGPNEWWDIVLDHYYK